ncbi:MAG TPA: glutamate formimidoyltransferase [Anaerolineae bacterium]|nr:glutamate formimidoyltransferase [Anaerolineae bacterium]
MKPKRIVEAVPNFSEGRRHEVIKAIVDAYNSVPGARVINFSSDPDHNRTVVTIVGEPDAVSEALFRGIAKAAELIDMDVQEGEHPRIGATDVAPFVPIKHVTMEEAVQLARDLAQRVSEELGIPVYLYARAATRPDREVLSRIRKGEYEGLKADLEAGKKERFPDFGPPRLGKAGATVIGARPPLIAYNIYLTTDDVSVAKKIAKAVRHSSGGLRYVQAMGLLVECKAQVSMNLLDYTKTPVFRVTELVRREAARYGVGIQSAELVGLIPQQALIDAAQWYLQLDNLTPEGILENHLEG